jgi:Kef-type K+ transport system membrane component KefB
MSEQPNEPVLNKGPSPKLIVVLFVAAAALWGISALLDATGRSADEKLGSILPFILGLLVFIAAFVMPIVWLVKRKKARAQ